MPPLESSTLSLAPTTPSETRLLVAEARAGNTDAILRVVDESLERAAQLREEREARRDRDREIEARRQRAAAAERQEREDAERLATRRRIEADAIAEAAAARRKAAEALQSRRPPRLDTVI